MAAPDADCWKEAMDKEMSNLKSHEVYELVPRTKGMRPLRLGWVLHRKHKGRLVARGNHQRPGIDYGESFSPVMRLESLRTILALDAIRDLDVIQFDITSAYLHGTLKEEAYMEQPEGYVLMAKLQLSKWDGNGTIHTHRDTIRIPCGLRQSTPRPMYTTGRPRRHWMDVPRLRFATVRSPTLRTCVHLERHALSSNRWRN